MMAHWTLPHLYGLLLSGRFSRWRWQLLASEPGEAPVRALVQDDGSGGIHMCGIYAFGETLSLQARVWSLVTPSLLREASERAMLIEDAKERLQSLSHLAQRLTQRAYHHKRDDEYIDLRHLRSALALLQGLLEASAAPGIEELLDAEEESGQQPAQPLPEQPFMPAAPPGSPTKK